MFSIGVNKDRKRLGAVFEFYIQCWSWSIWMQPHVAKPTFLSVERDLGKGLNGPPHDQRISGRG